ncbi:hypothetical protein NDU88_003160 [Pleurodeles waltl]|uniref:Uncharacterized protein n=1 Tax=Pleurodeles waltl TaxID=8319 RepID=A0AAV7P940_PLEWA|nr:hypothetical protein NDU88_003160 [Pleurodeles waltl]
MLLASDSHPSTTSLSPGQFRLTFAVEARAHTTLRPCSHLTVVRIQVRFELLVSMISMLKNSGMINKRVLTAGVFSFD